MKIGFCCNIFREEEMDESLARLGRMGYDGVELWEEFLFKCDPRRLKENLKYARLEVAQQCAYFDFTGSAEEWQKSLETNARHLALARELGSKQIRVFTGEVGSREATPAQWEAGIRGLAEVCRAGAAAGVSYAMETHEGSLMDTIEGTQRLLKETGAPNLGVNLQLPMSKDWEGWEPAVAALGSRTVHLHVHNWKDKKCKQRTFLADGIVYHFPTFLKALVAQGFNGCVSLEHTSYRDRWEIAAHELGYLRALMESLGVRAAKK